MTTCSVPFDRLSAYVDGELSPDDELAVRRHLDVCSVCAAGLESLLTVKGAVAASAEIRPVPHTLRERIALLPRARARGRHVRLIHLGVVAAALVLAVAVVGRRHFAGTPEHRHQLSEALVADHIHFLNEPSAFEIASNDADRVAAALGAHTDFPVAVPRIEGAALLGGRLCSLWGQKVALTFYDAHGTRLSLFIANRARFPFELTGLTRCTAPIRHYAVCLLAVHDRVFAIVGERAPAADMLAALENGFDREKEASE